MRGLRTLAERFFEMDGDVWQKEDGTKQDSLNHHFWGDISAWFIAYVAGIKVAPDLNDLERIEIAPDFISALTFAEGKFNHRKGEIVSRWERTQDGNIVLYVTIPKGLNATLRLQSGYCCANVQLSTGAQKITITKG